MGLVVKFRDILTIFERMKVNKMKIEMNLEIEIKKIAKEAIKELYAEVAEDKVQITKTRKEFEGDYTLVVFPLLALSKKSPEKTAEEIGEKIVKEGGIVESYNVIKGFLNLELKGEVWLEKLNKIAETESYGVAQQKTGRRVMVEYSSPNTNKPLHLGHIRNNLLGYSISELLKANGDEVVKVNLINDRGIHICKSMLAWQRYGKGETPQSTGEKGDHLVGRYYVEFDRVYKEEIKKLVESGVPEERAKQEAQSIKEAQQMLVKWEQRDPEVMELWERMNGWVYEGFEQTYKAMGVDFDRVYYESQTYLLGKQIVESGLKAGVLDKKEDGSVWIDLEEHGMDEKLLLRGDGTSVYMTQDLGTALQRVEEYNPDSLIYVVGNEQIYHFQVLKIVLQKLGYNWAERVHHLSYGMVELPEGKMKSREGTVVDADDLIKEMVETAKQTAMELGKGEQMQAKELEELSRVVAMGALKYFILKVDPKKTMLFDPKESIDFNGNTGPFIQYTHARIYSLLKRAEAEGISYKERVAIEVKLSPEELEVIKLLNELPEVVHAASENLSPALVAGYAYDLAKRFNVLYQELPVLKEVNGELRSLRLQLSEQVGRALRSSMKILGIEMPQRM